MTSHDLDSHKLHYHPERVAAWLSGFVVGPITIELSVTTACNQRCSFCGFDYRRSPHAMTGKQLSSLAVELAKGMPLRRLRAVSLAGEGEPTLVDLEEFVTLVTGANIRVGMMTNGMSRSFLKYVDRLSWIRFSVNAAKEDTYGLLHGVKGSTLNTVLETISEVAAKKDRGYTVGVQTVLLPENFLETYTLANILGKMDVDYYIVKPFTHHPQSANDTAVSDDYYQSHVERLAEHFSTLKGPMRAIIRRNAFSTLFGKRTPRGCPAASFFHFVSANGGVYSCNSDVGIDACCIGNVFADPWQTIIKDQRRKKILTAYDSRDCSKCRLACRLYAANEYLLRLRNPSPHDSFI